MLDKVRQVQFKLLPTRKLLFQCIAQHAPEIFWIAGTWFPTMMPPASKPPGSDYLPGRKGERSTKRPMGFVLKPEAKTTASSHILLSGIPDKLIICTRRVFGNQNSNGTDSYATIK